MKGNLARSGLCSFVTSVDFGLYSSIVGTRCDCCVWAIRGHSSAEPAASMLTKPKIVRQNLIRQLPVSKSRTIASHEQARRVTRSSETNPRRGHKFSILLDKLPFTLRIGRSQLLYFLLGALADVIAALFPIHSIVRKQLHSSLRIL